MKTLELATTCGANTEATLPGLMTLERAGRFLDVSVSTVRRLVKADELHTVPVMGAVRIPTIELVDFINKRRQQRVRA